MPGKFAIILFLGCTINIGCLSAQTKYGNFIESITKINDEPIPISFSNSLEVNNQGGHLQGIQMVRYNDNAYFILSGSSDTYSYYTIVRGGEKNMVIAFKKILDKPFKHAGGFQIHKNLMAIGVEDNEEKNVSKVFIFYLENPEKTPDKPLAIIDRMGTFKRATAGCVGIVTVREKVLVVVGDWDTAHLDFYLVDEKKLLNEGATLELEYSLDSKVLDKSSWSDPDWLSYQNINLLKDNSENLYLAGMTSIASEENVIDLFLIETEDLTTFKLKKLYSKSFPANAETKFRWGAGISITNNRDLEVLSCGENIHEASVIHIYK